MQRLNKVIKELRHQYESPIEKLAIQELVDNYEDLEFKTQFEVGRYRLDIAFPEHKVGLEIDGIDYHSTNEQRARDELRDEYLTKVKGWKIERVPAWFVKRNTEASMVKVLRHIPGIEKYKHYEHAKTLAIQWLYRDLYNTGDINLVSEKQRRFI